MATTSPEVRETPAGEILSKCLAKWSRLCRQGEVRPTHAARVRGPRHWRTRKDPSEGGLGRSASLDTSRTGCHGQGTDGQVASGTPGRFQQRQLRTMQRRVKEWCGIMAKELGYAGTAAASAEHDGLPELAPIGMDPRC